MRRLFRWRPALMLTTGLDEGIRLWDTRVYGPAGDVFDLMVEDQAASPGGSPPGSPGSLGSAEVNEAKELRFEQFEKWVEVGWVETTRAAQERRARVSREEEVMTDLVEQARIADEVKTEEERVIEWEQLKANVTKGLWGEDLFAKRPKPEGTRFQLNRGVKSSADLLADWRKQGGKVSTGAAGKTVLAVGIGRTPPPNAPPSALVKRPSSAALLNRPKAKPIRPSKRGPFFLSGGGDGRRAAVRWSEPGVIRDGSPVKHLGSDPTTPKWDSTPIPSRWDRSGIPTRHVCTKLERPSEHSPRGGGPRVLKGSYTELSMLAKGEQEHERPSSAGMPLPKVIVPLDELDAAMVTEKLLWEARRAMRSKEEGL